MAFGERFHEISIRAINRKKIEKNLFQNNFENFWEFLNFFQKSFSFLAAKQKQDSSMHILDIFCILLEQLF